MLKKNLINKVGWVLTSSSLGLMLTSSIHAADVRKVAEQDSKYVVAQVTPVSVKPGKKLTAQQALQRGLGIVAKAKTAKEHILAFEYISYAAKQGLPEAQFQCAIMHLDNQYAPADDDRAMRLLEMARDQGHKQAAVALNYIRYAEDGIGC